MPCNSVTTEIGIIQGEKGKIHEECKPELVDQQRYLEKSHVLIYVN